MSERKYYCFCGSNCKYETMTKEQILATIAQAAADGLVVEVEDALVTKVKERNKGGYATFWIGTKAEYNALGDEIKKECFCLITDDTREEDMAAAISRLLENAESVESALNDIDYEIEDIHDIFSEVRQNFDNINETLKTKSNVGHKHDGTYSMGMVCRFETGAISRVEYTAPAEPVKFYNVTMGNLGSSDGSNNLFTGQTIFVDYAALQRLSSYSQWYLIYTATGDYDKLIVSLNTDGTVKFYLDNQHTGYKILHVAGYY